MNKVQAPVWLLLLAVFAYPAIIEAEVTIIRTLPDSGTRQAEAEWKSPRLPTDRPAAAEAAPSSRLSGRLIVGGYGSGSADTVTVDDWSTDSQVSFRTYAGRDGLMDLQAQAFRETGIDSFTQRYNGDLLYSAPSFSVKVSGNYDQSEELTLDGESVQTAGGLGFDMSTSEEVNIPFQLHYASSWDEQEYEVTGETDSEEQQQADHALELNSTIPLGMMSLQVDGGVDIHHDRIEDVSSRGYGGTIGATFPLSEVIGLYTGVSPHYSETEYQITENKTQERSLGSDAGVLFTFSEQIEGEVHARRTDAWRSDPSFSTDELSHTEIWSASTRWSVQAPEELTNTAEYLISREAAGSFSQDFNGSTTYEQEDAFLRRAGAKGRMLLSNAEADVPDRETLEWGGFLLLEPADGMKIDTNYKASRTEDDEMSLRHDVASDYNHAPVEGLSYGLGGSYSYQEESALSTSTYSGNSRVNVQPVLGYRRIDLGISELFQLEDKSAGQNLLSKSTFSSALPLTKQFKLRYLFSWEWVDLMAEDAEEGSAFLHTAGFTLAGPGIPFNVNSSYLVGHGYRGLQHQLDTRLEVPLLESFSLISKLSYRYAEAISYETPFLFSTLVHYEF